MQIITRVDGQEVEQNIEGLNKEQALLLAEQALSKPQTLQVKITRQSRRRMEREQAKALRRRKE
jgi:hypothetical protein